MLPFGLPNLLTKHVERRSSVGHVLLGFKRICSNRHASAGFRSTQPVGSGVGIRSSGQEPATLCALGSWASSLGDFHAFVQTSGRKRQYDLRCLFGCSCHRDRQRVDYHRSRLQSLCRLEVATPIGMTAALRNQKRLGVTVIPAKAGIQTNPQPIWVPACAEMTGNDLSSLGPPIIY